MKKQAKPDAASIAKVAGNPRDANELRERVTKRLQEIYRGRYGYRQTASGKVPTRVKTGGKLFEEFCREAYKDRKRYIDDVDMRNIYNSARSLEYEKWVWFLNNEYGSRI